MAASGSSKSAQERREAQREALRKQRQAELKRQRTVRTVVIAAITVVALVLATGLGFLIYRAVQPEGPVAVPEGMSEEQPYLSVGAPEDSGKPVLEIHLDFICPFCGQFEELNGDDIEQMVAEEEATVNFVPRRGLDSASTTGDYSSRAANALVCVWDDDPDNVIPFQQLMFANQPAEGSAGLDDDQIWAYAQEAGASDEVQSCIGEKTYQPWVRQVADPYGSETGGGTPYVEIDGTTLDSQQWSQPGQLREAVLAAGGEAAPSDGGGASDGGEG
ncbi:thioredoxin domain-containing protein [Brachybacterium sp. AOP43-C2-M15]|uniref:thioredoxin domain-containing protein n=1 Tax=Brachybacterium sp. AOP43-C2-M15 TaxID=3457661 RepID=UPI0040341217